jgi:hypothetical protein
MACYSVDLLSGLHVAHWGEIVAGLLYSDGGVPSFSSVIPGIYLKHPMTVPPQIHPDLSYAVMSPRVAVEFWASRLGCARFPAVP